MQRDKFMIFFIIVLCNFSYYQYNFCCTYILYTLFINVCFTPNGFYNGMQKSECITKCNVYSYFKRYQRNHYHHHHYYYGKFLNNKMQKSHLDWYEKAIAICMTLCVTVLCKLVEKKRK